MELICPICGEPLVKKEKQYLCVNRHSYDIARKGYVNLLTAGEKSSADPGDNKDMINARRTMMEAGYYSQLVRALACVQNYPSGEVLDLGCGEGVITRALGQYSSSRLGIDISKHAVEYAAARDKQAVYAVASCNKLPLQAQSVDIAVNCFAPLKEEELLRVLKPKGVLIKVTPAPEHLFELKSAIYPKAYVNPQDETPSGFKVLDCFFVHDQITAEGDALNALLRMTPYFYTTPKELLQKVVDKRITTSLVFSVRILGRQ